VSKHTSQQDNSTHIQKRRKLTHQLPLFVAKYQRAQAHRFVVVFVLVAQLSESVLQYESALYHLCQGIPARCHRPEERLLGDLELAADGFQGISKIGRVEDLARESTDL
jgi:hypothetical protein